MPTKTKENIIKYGKIEIPMNTGTSPYLPQKPGKFIDHGEILKTLAIGIRDNLPILMIGESGTGKTSAIRFLANQTGNGLRRVNLNGGTTPDELIGRNMLNTQGTYWVDGVLAEAMRSGEWIVLDEINAALPEVLFILQSILDDDGYLVLNEKDDKEIVRKHANFRLFATCNPPEYAGTKELNKALLSRFPICINAEFPPEKTELEIIKNHLGDVIAKSNLAEKLVGLANDTRKAKELGTSDYAINTRDVLNTLRLSENMEPAEALGLAFSNKLETADKNALKSMARLHLPTSRKKATASREEVKDIEDLKIGGIYIMDSDIHNAYFGVQTNEETYNEMIKGEISEIISAGRENGIKGDEFQIEALFWEEGDEATRTEVTGQGKKMGSAIKIIAGPNKGKMGFLMHHKDLDNTADIIKSIHEIK